MNHRADFQLKRVQSLNSTKGQAIEACAILGFNKHEGMNMDRRKAYPHPQISTLNQSWHWIVAEKVLNLLRPAL